MILPDVNVLIYAFRADSEDHQKYKEWLESVINGAFTVPGDGAVDFAALIRLLHDHGYRGWLVVEAEQDPAVAPSYVCADRGYRHLRTLVHRVQEHATP